MDSVVHSNDVIVSMRGVTKKFNLRWRRGLLVALENFDLEVRRGEIFGLLGPNGSGKSTAFKILLGLLKATQGEVHVGGCLAGTMDAKRLVGFLPENPYFPQFLTAPEVLEYYGPLCGLRGKQLKSRVEELLHLADLDRATDRPLRTFSKGMLQRVGLAQALLHDPELLILDEPTAGVDPIGSRQLKDLILSLSQMGKTIIFSSHLLDQVQEVAHRVAILHRGIKLKEGKLSELLTVPNRMDIETPLLPPEAIEEFRKIVAKYGNGEMKVRNSENKLEEFFIRSLKEVSK